MRWISKLLVFLIIFLPLVAGFLKQPIPQVSDVTMDLVTARKAMTSADFGTELSALERILEFSPWRRDLWQRAGRLYLDLKQCDRAINAFESARSTGQLDEQGKIWLADATLSCGQVNEARKILSGLSTDDPFLLMQIAALQRKTGDLDGAIVTLTQAVKLDTQNIEINYQLGIELMPEKPKDAVQYLKYVAQNNNRALSAKYLADTIDYYSELIGSAEWYLHAGQALSAVNEWDIAVKSFTLATDVSPHNADGWALLGEAQQQAGMDGKNSLDKAILIDPNGELSNGLMGLYYRRQGNAPQAVGFLQKALLANSRAVVWQIEIGNTLADDGQLDEALAAYEAAIKINDTVLDSWEALAKFSLTRNYQVKDVGLPAAQQALSLDTENPVDLDLVGTAYMILGDLNTAEQYFNRALENDPGAAAILIHLGQSALYRGDKESAFAYFRQASANARDERLREMADRLLKENGGK